MKLTKATIAKLPAPDPSGKQCLHWDDDVKGFGVLCSGATATKSYVVQRGVNGRKRRVTLGTVAEFDAAGKTADDVRTLAAERLLDMRAGKDPKARDYANVTLQRALDDYLAARPNLSERSRAGYRATVEGRFKRWLDRPLREITPDMIEMRYREIKEEVAAEHKKAVERRHRRAERRGEEPPKKNDLNVSEPGAATANAALRTLRAIWHFAAGRTPELPPWPAARFKRQWFRVGRRERHVPADDLKAFYEAVNEKDEKGEYTLGRGVRDYILLLLFTGLRRGEAASLKWENVDLSARILRLPAKVTKSGRKLDLPMSDLVGDLLVARRRLGVEGDYVFPGVGKSGHIEEPKKALKKIAERCGVRANPHALRSTFITVASDVPMSAYALKGLMNHSVGDDVTAGYVQLTTESLRKPAQAIANRLKGYCGIAAPRGRNIEKIKHLRKRRA